FDIALALTNIHQDLPEMRNDITMIFSQSPENISGNIQYNSKLFRKETIECFAGHFMNVLRSALQNTVSPICELEILSEAEWQEIVGWNSSRQDYPADHCIHEVFEAQAARTPQREAIRGGQEVLTYEELDRRANQLARYLRGVGVGPEVRVGV